MAVLRTVRLSVNTWRRWASSIKERVQAWYLQRTCPHLFRAALINKQGGRVCKMCDLAQPLSREDFYAEFGERYQAMLHVDAPITVRRESHYVSVESDQIQ
jgi:hypothetical protein